YEIGRTISIGEHRLEQLGALDQSSLERLPFSSVDQERHVTERPRPLRPRCVLVDAIEHAGVVQVAIGGGEAAGKRSGYPSAARGGEGRPQGGHAPRAVPPLL